MAHLTPATTPATTPAMRRQMAANRKRILAREATLATHIDAIWRQAQSSITPAQAALIAAYTRELDTITGTPDESDDEGTTLPQQLPRVPPMWAKDSGHLSLLQRAVVLAVGSFATASILHVTDGQQSAVQAGAADARTLLQTALEPLAAQVGARTADALVRHAPVSALDAFVGRSQTTGNSLYTLLGTMDDATAAKVVKTLHAALASGSHPDVAARMLTDATGMARNRALTVSRTELIGAYRSASLAQYRASSDIVRGWTWIAAKDARTCAFCASMDGTEHTLGEDLNAMTHPNCRCCPGPLVKSADDLDSQLAL